MGVLVGAAVLVGVGVLGLMAMLGVGVAVGVLVATLPPPPLLPLLPPPPAPLARLGEVISPLSTSMPPTRTSAPPEMRVKGICMCGFPSSRPSYGRVARARYGDFGISE
jgi:hypothetical protein